MLRKPFFWAILVILLIGGAVGYYYKSEVTTLVDRLTGRQAATTQAEKVTTAPVTTGDIVLRVSGVGNLLASNEVKLGFGTSGLVKTVNVQLGDEVKVGTVLATLDDTSARFDVVQAGIALRQAQLQLLKLTQPTSDTIATATANLASAQADLMKLTQPPASQIAAAQSNLVSAQQAYNIPGVRSIQTNRPRCKPRSRPPRLPWPRRSRLITRWRGAMILG